MVLCILSAVLVSSLLLSDVEDKTFEYGMLRTLGMTQGGLVILVCIQVVYMSFSSCKLIDSIVAYIFPAWRSIWTLDVVFNGHSNQLRFGKLHWNSN